MLKTSPKPTGALSATGIEDSKDVGSSGGNKRKLAKSDFTKPVHRAEKHSFLTSNARRAFTQLRQTFTKAPILQHFDSKRHIWIETDVSGCAIGDVLH